MKLNFWKNLFICMIGIVSFSCSEVIDAPVSNTKEDLAVAFKKGEDEAMADVARGILTIKSWGMPPYSGKQTLLKEKYNINLENVSGYFSSFEEDEYIKGYNSISMKAIQKKYGKDFFERIDQEVLKKYPLKNDNIILMSRGG